MQGENEGEKKREKTATESMVGGDNGERGEMMGWSEM